jgi:hypothetical protein
MTIVIDGTVIENKIFTRQVVIRANNVTIRNCLSRSKSDFWGFLVQAGYSGVLFEDIEVDGLSSPTMDAAIGGSGSWTARRMNIHGMSDGIKIGSSNRIEDSYIHDLETTDLLPHQDGVQSMGGDNMVIRHNTILSKMGNGQNSAIFLAEDFGPINNVTIENNLLNGGGYTVWSLGGLTPPTNVRLLNNHFGRDSVISGFGLLNLQGSVERSGNVWHDTLEPIPGG